MPFLDDLGSALSRAGEDLSKAGRVNQLKQQLSGLTGRRQALTLQLGEALLTQLQESEDIPEAFQEIYNSITGLEDERKAIESELEELAPTATTTAAVTCPSCGAPVSAGDSFCEKCGAKLVES